MKKIEEWYELYPQGTQEGDEEAAVFIALTRNKKWRNWRSVSALSKETKLDPKIIERVIYKYYKIGLIIQNPKNAEFWGYLYNNPDDAPEEDLSIIEHEKNKIFTRRNLLKETFAIPQTK